MCVSSVLANMTHIMLSSVFSYIRHLSYLYLCFTLLMVHSSYPHIDACRRAARRPLLRHELLSLLHVFDNPPLCNGISSSPSRHRVSVLHSSMVCDLFGVDKSSLALFNSLGGILLRSEYAAVFALRHRILCDTSFWTFWDLVVMQSGWSLLDVKMFNDQYNNGLYCYICIVRDLPSTSHFCSLFTQSSPSCVPLVSMSLDSLSFFDDVYDGLLDICWMLLQKSSIVGLYGSSKQCSSSGRCQYTEHQLCCFKYQLQKLKRMVDVRCPAADILSFCMDINALIICWSSSVSSHFDVCSTSYVSSLLDMEVMSVVHSSRYFHRVKKIVSVVDSIIW